MKICQSYHPGTIPFTIASGESKFTDNCSNCDSHPRITCGYCEGEGWIYWSDGEGNEGADACSECLGDGYVEGEPEPLTLEDLDYRAPIDTLMEAWASFAARGVKSGARRRIAGICDKRLSWQYRVSEC